MLEYHDEFNKLTPAEQIGRRIAIFHEMEFDVDLTWKQCSAKSILQEVTQTLNWPSISQQLENQKINEFECLNGIQYWLDMRLDAEPWAEDLAVRCFKHYEGDIDYWTADQSRVDYWLNAESEEDEELWGVRCQNPLFYGELGFELQRILSRMVRKIQYRPSDSGALNEKKPHPELSE
ncbi:hypothetical protein [Acidovorax soli]|uniref:hypothetical protein n=1 Tax=Acidovorax soli TaxID=592050 RepID=UPI0032B107C0